MDIKHNEKTDNYLLFYKMQEKALLEFSNKIEMAEKLGKKIVLLYQMGKVGSRSLDYSLQNNKMEVEVFHLHRMLPSSNLKHIMESVKNGNIPQAVTFRIWLEIFEKIILKKKQVYIISGVREPISRNMSAFFQNLNASIFTDFKLNNIVDLFFDTYPHNTPLNWFDIQFLETLGIDVYQYPFDKKTGVVEFCVDNLNVLIMSVEIDNMSKEEFVKKFLNLQFFKIENHNVGSEKPYAKAYKELKDKIKFPDSYVERMLNSKYTKHFFDEKFIKLTKKKYS